jgi:hypothetical protein
MRRFFTALALFILLCGLAPAYAHVVITVNKSAQRLSVAVDGRPLYDWPVSTARWGYRTPNGIYRPQRLARRWYSRKYDWSPMPYSIFFDGGYAIHGSYEVSRIGRPASHGCIRLHPAHAAVLFALVEAHRRDTEIVITGTRPDETIMAHRTPYEPVTRRQRHRYLSRSAEGFEDIFSAPRRHTIYTVQPSHRYWRYR